MDTDEKRMRRVFESLITEVNNSQEAWSLSRELSGQLETKPLAQVLLSHLPDKDHQDAAEKMEAAVDEMYRKLKKRDTGEALPLAAACYILSEEEREDPYALGLNAVALLAGRRILDAIKDANLPKNEQISAFYDYYWEFLQKDTLMQARHLREVLRKYLDTNGTREERTP